MTLELQKLDELKEFKIFDSLGNFLVLVICIKIRIWKKANWFENECKI